MKRKLCLLLAVLMSANVMSTVVFAEETGTGTGQVIQETAEVTAENGANTENEAATEDGTNTENEAAIKDDENTVNLYVAAKKSDEPDTYRDLVSALDAAAKIDRQKKQVIITLLGGTHEVDKTITLDSKISGSEKYPLIIKSEKGQNAILEAGKSVQGTKINGKNKFYSRFPTSVKERIFKIDLSSMKNVILGSRLMQYPNMAAYDASSFGNWLDISYDGEMMNDARYPNIGTVKVAANSSDAQVLLTDENIDAGKWVFDDNVRFVAMNPNGYMFFGGILSGYNPSTKKFALSMHAIGTTEVQTSVSVGSRLSFRNAPEFLDQAGEYFIDLEGKAIYFYPPDEAFTHDVRIMSLRTPVISIEKANNIVFDGITVQNAGESGIVVSESRNCTIKNCTVKNVSGSAVKILSSSGITVENSTVHDVGLVGIHLDNGGNYRTLTSSGNVVKNCDVYSVGRLSQVAGKCINLSNETGTVIANNRTHDVTHEGIFLNNSTACRIENNEVYNAVNDTYDAGAIYAGGSRFKGVGNIYKNNYIHNIRLSEDAAGGAVVGLYWDDQISGQTADGNIFADNAFGMLVGGGDWNTVKNNIFYKSNASMTFDNRGEGWQKAIDGGAMTLRHDSELGAGNTLWDKTYPYTKKVYDYAKSNNLVKLNAPDENVIKNNLIINTGGLSLAKSVTENALEIANNYKTPENDTALPFADANNFDFTYPQDAKISEIPDFEYIDFSKMGLTEEKAFSKPQLLAPKNGAENIEGNNVVLKWKDCNGADKYRLQIAMDKDFRTLIYDNAVKGRKLQLNNIKYNKTFYWRVQPIAVSKSEKDGEFSVCFSFTTARSEIKNTKELDSLITKLGNKWKKVPEGTRAGTYQQGAIDELGVVVDEAETVLYNTASKMYDVKNVTAKLKNAISVFGDKMNVDTIEAGSWIKNEKNWTISGAAEFDGKTMHLGNGNENGVYSGQQLSRGQLLKFKAKFDLTNYQGWGFNQEDLDQPFWNSTGYSIVIKRNAFEVQKRYKHDGRVDTSIIKTFSNEESICTSDVWYTIETGVLSTVLGPRIIVRIDGKTAVDYVDTSDTPADEIGYFSFLDSSRTTGLYIAGSDYTE